MRLVIASNNKNKINEIKEILGNDFDEIVSMSEAGIDVDIEENGKTFIENSLIKARYVASTLNCAAIADDSGLEVYALNGQPGIYSARYCGHHGDDDANNKKLLEEMKSIEDRDARYVCAIALVRPDEEELVATGYCPGVILEVQRGTGGFGYDPLFYLKAFDKTMAEIDMETKNKISHRYNALIGLKNLLEKQI
jgi:XTP/dITP diphosphohydrolase